MKAMPLLLTLTVVFLYSITMSWAIDPNISSQSTDLRSNGVNGNPGFNPCLGGVRDANGLFGGAVFSTALLSPANLSLFSKLGPGSVTDNMFGIIEQPTEPKTCGPIGGGGSVEIGQNQLNCGSVFYNPVNQGQIDIDGKNELMTSAPVNWNNTLSADFCATGATDCLDNVSVQKDPAHVGFNVTNNFSWDRTSDSTANVISSQSIEQVTAVKTSGIGSFATPGSGDQSFLITNSFSMSSTNNKNNVGSPLVTWSLMIEDPDQSGTGTGKWRQVIGGTFTLNNNLFFPSVQYPDGQSQTNQSTSSTLP